MNPTMYAPNADTAQAARTRVEWTLREHGRFPTYDEIVAVRDADRER